MKTRVYRYLLLNKPYGVQCDFRDDAATAAAAERRASGGVRGEDRLAGPGPRLTLTDYLLPPGVEPAGRLDQDSEGLVLLTDDGGLMHRLTHPAFHQPKTYLVQVEGVPDEAALAALREGVMVKGRRTAPAQVDLLAAEPSLPPCAIPVRDSFNATAWLLVVLTEGRKRQIRHMTAAVGHPALRLVRLAIGPLRLGDLGPGEWRDLTPQEKDALRAAVGSAPAVPR